MDSYLSQVYFHEMKHKQSHPVFELELSILFSTTKTVLLNAESTSYYVEKYA